MAAMTMFQIQILKFEVVLRLNFKVNFKISF
jgi:hypothetical protein